MSHASRSSLNAVERQLSGASLVTVAIPIDPPDDDWSRVMVIVCQIVEEQFDTGKLRSR
jgi:hypothetical protein